MTAAEKTAWDALQAERDALLAENAAIKRAADEGEKLKAAAIELIAKAEALTAENAELKADQETILARQALELEATQKVRDTLLAENDALKKASAELLAENDALKASAPTVAAPAGPVEYVSNPDDPEPAQDPYTGTDTPAWKAWAERRTIKQ